MALGAAVSQAPVAFAGTDDFTITNYKVQMELGRDSARRSTLRTVETITAEFPQIDQNHGLERVFVKEYDNHPIDLDVQSVTDEKGQSVPFHWSDAALRIGSGDEYVRGSKTYVITYTSRDVTKYYSDTNRDEFYWDAIGVNWRVPIKNASIQLTLSDELSASATGTPRCHVGTYGSTDTCTITQTGNRYDAFVSYLGTQVGVTTVIGFAPKTFAGYEKGIGEKILEFMAMVQAATVGIAMAAIAWISLKFSRLTSRNKEIGPVPAEFIPPKDLSVTAASGLISTKGNAMAAQLVDLAVRGYIKMYQTKTKGFLRQNEYEIVIVKSPSDLKQEEVELLSDMYGNVPAPNDRLEMKSLQNNYTFTNRLSNNDTKLDLLMKSEYGLKEDAAELKSWLRRAALILVALGVFTLSIPFMFTALVVFIMSLGVMRVTDRGLDQKRYLTGLKEYIGMAEAERLQMLQSPQGAEKVGPINMSDGKQMIKLYERNLPYAILFGQEKEWSKELGRYYEQLSTTPDWYVGQGVFNAMMFSNAMNGISIAAQNADSSSSSSGGSSGGGFSGGGGGGGGGGGW